MRGRFRPREGHKGSFLGMIQEKREKMDSPNERVDTNLFCRAIVG